MYIIIIIIIVVVVIVVIFYVDLNHDSFELSTICCN